jgi:hypothetical protein
LWQAFGGENSMSKVNSRLQLSEISQEIVAEFANTIISHKPGFRRDLNPENYIQPLKQAQIGYLINKTGSKNGAVNVNS